jgi:hypothetical protein
MVPGSYYFNPLHTKFGAIITPHSVCCFSLRVLLNTRNIRMAPAADRDPHQANDFPVDASSHYGPRQPHNHALQNVWVSFDIGTSAICRCSFSILYPSGPARSRQWPT